MARRIVVWAMLMVGLAASVFIAGQRARVEFGNRAVELVVDYDEIAQIAASTGTTPVEVLERFKAVGATGVAVNEQTVENMLDERSFVPIDQNTYVIYADSAERVINRLRNAIPQLRASATWSHQDQTNSVVLSVRGVPLSAMKLIAIGIPREGIEAGRAAGLDVVARLVNYPGANPNAIDAALADLKRKGIDKVIFAGDQVLGFKGAVSETARSFAKHGIYFGMVEFAKQKGETPLAAKAPANVMIVHSITSNEMPTLDAATIEERFQKAVRERGARVLYVRMYDTASENLIGSNLAYVDRIARAITSAGYGLKIARPAREIDVPRAVRIAAGIGVAAGALMLLLALVDLSGIAFAAWTVALLVFCAGGAAQGDFGRKAVAFLSALSFPTLAALYAIRGSPEKPTPADRPLLRAIGRLVGALAIAVAGGILIVGLLSERHFMLRLDQFMGVKLAHLLPVVALAVLFAGGLAWRSDTWSAQKERFVKSLRELGSIPVLMWQAAGMAVILGAVAYMVMRSGNEGLEVSGVELKFRAVLDKLLYVRPRTKEFLIGYPVLLLGIAFAIRGWRRWAAPLVVVGAIGLVSSLNSFCHIHTPLLLTAIRTVNGAAVGALVGAVLYWIVRNAPGTEKAS